MVSCAFAFALGATTSSNISVEEFHDTFTIWPASAETIGGPADLVTMAARLRLAPTPKA
jgi:hypothetical protein